MATRNEHQAVPQVETPFLQVTLEDSGAFGTHDGATAKAAGESAARADPTAHRGAFAAAEPEAIAEPSWNAPAASDERQRTRNQLREFPSSFHRMERTAPAPESVPASSGPSVPNLPSPFAGASRGSDPKACNRPPQRSGDKGSHWRQCRCEFRSRCLHRRGSAAQSRAVADEESLGERTSAEHRAASTAAPKRKRVTEVKIALPLLPILKSLPPMQLTGDPGCVPPDVRLELPFSLIEPQLASGRISVTAKSFCSESAGQLPRFVPSRAEARWTLRCRCRKS